MEESHLFLHQGACSGQQSHRNSPSLISLLAWTAARLDHSSLDPDVQVLFSSGLASSTQRTYHSGSRGFTQFCGNINITHPFPGTECTLSYFIAYLHEQGLSAGSVNTYLVAIRHAQISLGLGSPQVGNAIARICAEEHQEQVRKQGT